MIELTHCKIFNKQTNEEIIIDPSKTNHIRNDKSCIINSKRYNLVFIDVSISQACIITVHIIDA